MKLDTQSLNQLIPAKYKYLLDNKKIKYKEIDLKTDYLVNIINELIVKYYFQCDDVYSRDSNINLWSLILKEKYGKFYNYYIDYLVDIGFMTISSNYLKNVKARTYRLNSSELFSVKRCKITDKFLIKKYSKDFLQKSFLELNNSPIPYEIRAKLVDDLYKVKIDNVSALNYLDDLKSKDFITETKYMKNKISVENISANNIFFKFDEYGRIHTNFTVLKKHIRHNFLTFENEPIVEIDIANSQPLFLAVLMKRKLSPTKLVNKDVTRYIELVQNGLIYEELMKKAGIDNRDDCKIMLYRVLFGNNNDKKKEDQLFFDIFPNVLSFIKNYKSENKNYKSLSHDLQQLESEFIFNDVVAHIMRFNKEIPIFTVHDSISCPLKYKNDVDGIFNFHKNKLFQI